MNRHVRFARTTRFLCIGSHAVNSVMERMHSFDGEKHDERLESMEIERFLLASESQSEVTGI